MNKVAVLILAAGSAAAAGAGGALYAGKQDAERSASAANSTQAQPGKVEAFVQDLGPCKDALEWCSGGTVLAERASSQRGCAAIRNRIALDLGTVTAESRGQCKMLTDAVKQDVASMPRLGLPADKSPSPCRRIVELCAQPTKFQNEHRREIAAMAQSVIDKEADEPDTGERRVCELMIEVLTVGTATVTDDDMRRWPDAMRRIAESSGGRYARDSPTSTNGRRSCAWVYKRCGEIDPNRSPVLAVAGGADFCGMLQFAYMMKKGTNAQMEKACAEIAHYFEPGGTPEIPAGMRTAGGLFGRGIGEAPTYIETETTYEAVEYYDEDAPPAEE